MRLGWPNLVVRLGWPNSSCAPWVKYMSVYMHVCVCVGGGGGYGAGIIFWELCFGEGLGGITEVSIYKI